MVSKKKQTTRSKSNKKPQWKELALLLSKKRQLNVVLRREAIHATVASTSESGHSIEDTTSNSKLHNENLRNEDSLGANTEDIFQIKKQFIAPETALGLPSDSNDQPTSSNDTDETYNISINDFQSLLVATTKRSDIRLSIENINFNNIIDQTSAEHNNSKPLDCDLQAKPFEQNNIVMRATKKNKTRTGKTQRRRINKTILQPTKICQKSIKKNNNQISTEKNKAQENNLPSKSLLECSTNEKIREEKQFIPKKRVSRGHFRSEYKTRDEIQENELDQNQEYFAFTELEKTPRDRQAKRKIDNIEKQDQDKEQNKQDQLDENKKEESFPSTNKITKKLKRRSPKRQYKDTIQNAPESDNQQMEILSVPNFDGNSNVATDNNTHADEMPNNETGESEFCTTEKPKEYDIDIEKNKANLEPKSISIALELHSLKRKIIGISKSQKQIQAALQSTPNDRFEIFGKTIAACLRELPRFESQCLEIKLMDVLLEEKRNCMTLANPSMHGNGHNGE